MSIAFMKDPTVICSMISPTVRSARMVGDGVEAGRAEVEIIRVDWEPVQN